MARARLLAVDMPLGGSYAGIKYAFKSTVSAADSTVLGHEVLDGTSPLSGLIFKANNPKPPRAVKEFATGVRSSFVDSSAIVAASAAGWQITPSKRNGGRSKETRFAQVVYVTVNNIKYGWSIRKSLYRKIQSNLTSLGVRPALASDDDIVYGASFPKPPKVIIKSVQGDQVLAVETFYDPTNEAQLKANFAVKDGKFTINHWQSIAL